MAIDFTQGMTYIWLLLVSIALVTVWRSYFGELKKQKKVLGFNKGLVALVIGLVGAFSLVQTGLFAEQGFGPFFATTGQPQTPPTQPQAQQPLAVSGVVSVAAEDVTLTLLLHEKFNPSTEATTEFTDVYVEEWNEVTGTYSGIKDLGRKAEGSTLQVSPNDRLTLVPAVNSSSSGYYSRIDTLLIGLSGTQSYDGIISDVNTGDNAGLTITVNNVDGTPNAQASNNQSIGAGEVKRLKFRIDGAFEDEFSARKVCIACKYNKTAYDEIIVTSDAGDITKAISRDCPPEDLSIESTHTVDAYELSRPISHTESITGTITLDADDNNDPGDEVLDGGEGDIICSLHDQDVYIDSTTNLPMYGYQNDLGSDVGLGIEKVNMTIHITKN